MVPSSHDTRLTSVATLAFVAFAEKDGVLEVRQHSAGKAGEHGRHFPNRRSPSWILLGRFLGFGGAPCLEVSFCSIPRACPTGMWPRRGSIVLAVSACGDPARNPQGVVCTSRSGSCVSKVCSALFKISLSVFSALFSLRSVSLPRRTVVSSPSSPPSCNAQEASCQTPAHPPMSAPPF